MKKTILAVERAEGDIRRAVKDALFNIESNEKLKLRVALIIRRCLAEIEGEELKRAAKLSLERYFAKQKKNAQKLNRRILIAYLALTHLVSPSEYTKGFNKSIARDTLISLDELPDDVIINRGTALKTYHKEYFKKHVEPILEQLEKERALDAESTTLLGRNTTLRSRAEREARYEEHLNNLSSLKDKGVKLVIISTHADCSERCRPFQGRVFSLDGTSGKTDDGRAYEPIENATDIYTSGGKWKNGLFGFNCRHYAVEYKPGYRFPTPSLSSEKREYALSQKQRSMERNVRKWRIAAEMRKGTDPDAYRRARKKAISWNKKYEAFCHQNGIPVYPDRVKIL